MSHFINAGADRDEIRRNPPVPRSPTLPDSFLFSLQSCFCSSVVVGSKFRLRKRIHWATTSLLITDAYSADSRSRAAEDHHRHPAQELTKLLTYYVASKSPSFVFFSSLGPCAKFP